ncbi:glycosyltransferase family 2 protein [Methylomonas sp. MgM2]
MTLPNINIACVIITFNPLEKYIDQLLCRLLKSPVSIYIVDNWHSNYSRKYIKNLTLKFKERVILIELEKNYGIAKALNIGIDYARKEHHQFVILFDQDSLPQEGLIGEMKAIAEQLVLSDKQVTAIGPRLYDPRSNVFFKFASLKWGIWKKKGCNVGDGRLITCEFINSSGSMIFLDHWESIGPFREDFFIDHVETDWYMRARHLGYKCYGVCTKSYLLHHMGDSVCRYWLMGWRFMPHRSPERHYTIVRNAIWLSKMSYTPYSWAVNVTAKVIFTFLYFSLFDKNGKDQAKNILKGIRDGISISPSRSTTR